MKCFFNPKHDFMDEVHKVFNKSYFLDDNYT